MIKCPGCGEENPPKFKLCGYCGTPLHAPAPLPAHEVRKTVTLLFTDLKDSTALGERLDSEALHEVKERYFNAMAAEIRRHGGKIEKYIGDAIMAVFGLPRAHEDDALRAVRAAAGMQAELQRVNEALQSRFGVLLANRTGVNTGEVVASDDPTADQKLATGDAVNVTARLEAAAPANEIYLGETTWRLVRDAVDVEAVEPLTLKGKSQPVPAFRLVKVHGQDGNVRRHDMPVVGRDNELATLQLAWQAAQEQRRAQLVTVIGDAGVGKSRLVREFIDRLGGGAQVLFGRCLPYGDGITFWPLREMVLGAAGIRQDDTPEEAYDHLLAFVRDEEVADRLASAAGIVDTAFPLHEIYWAARRFMQAQAANEPVLAMFDDIHWAEPAFLDLIVNLLDTIEDAPVLLLATARHDLLEEHSEWGQRDRSSRLVLQPLGDEATAQVVSNLLGSAGLSEAFTRRIVDAAEGNPLYVEQMLSMLIDSGAIVQQDGRWVSVTGRSEIAVPPTIHALLEARLDKLDRAERAAVEPAAVIGMEFEQPAVESLAPAQVRDKVGEKLTSLARKQFIRQANSADRELLYRFHHHLVRETVYHGLLKRARANLHTEFVHWADKINADSDRGQEFEAILGYHLEQAYRYLGELGPHDAAGIEIGRDASRRLSSAGRRAFARGDMHAARNLYGRAVNLLGNNDPLRPVLLPPYAEALMELGEFASARDQLGQALAAAHGEGQLRVRHAAQLIGIFVRLYSGERGNWSDDALRVAQEAIDALQVKGAHEELANAHRLVALVHQISGRHADAALSIERVASHAREAGNERLVARSALGFALSALFGPMPVQQALAQCEVILQKGLSDRQVESLIQCKIAQLHAMRGEFDRARALYRHARALLRELGQGVHAASTGLDVAAVELMAGDLVSAEREVKADYAFLEERGETYFLSSMASLLARLVREQGRDEEALALSRTAEAAAAVDDLDAHVRWRSARAPILARTGQVDMAEALGHEAVDLALKTGNLSLQGDTLFNLAMVQHLAAKTDDARKTLGRARDVLEQKGDQVSVTRISDWEARMLDR